MDKEMVKEETKIPESLEVSDEFEGLEFQGVAEGNESESGMKFKFISPDQIRENKLNDETINNIEWMMESIRINGLRQPLDVLPEENGTTYRIIGGHRRFCAIKRGIKEGYGWFSKGIPCVIQERQIESTLDEQIVMHEENLSSRNYQEGNFLEGVKTLYMLYQEKRSEDKTFKASTIMERLAEKLKVGTRQAYKTAYIATSADAWITNAVENKLLTIDSASIIAHLDKEKQDLLHEYFDEHQCIPKEVLDKYRKNADKKRQDAEELDDDPETDSIPDEHQTDNEGDEAPKNPDTDDNSITNREVKDMVARYDDSNFYGDDGLEGIPMESNSSYDGYEDMPLYLGEKAPHDESDEDYMDHEENSFSMSDFPDEMRMTPPPAPQGSHMMQMDAALTALTWFSELDEKNGISEQERAYVDTIVKMLAKFYFPCFAKQGYIDNGMRDTIKEIVDMMSGLV